MTRLTPERLALLRATLAAKGLVRPEAAELRRRADPSCAPLSFAQERLYFLELYQPGTALHNDAVALRIAGALDVERVRDALAVVQLRHEILRTSFVLTGSGPEQRIHRLEQPPLAVVEVAGDAQARERASAEAGRPFDLERAPLWRVLLARCGADASWLVLTMHHLVSDGASMGLLLAELALAYERGPAALAPLAVQFGDYAVWERVALREEEAERDLAYWRGVLEGERPACVWPDGEGRASGQGGFVAFELERPLVAALADTARAARVTNTHVLLAAWFALLACTGGQEDVCTGIASSLRQRRELEPLIGFFVQSLALPVDLAGDPPFAEIVRRVRGALLAAQDHAAVPFDRVVRALGETGGAGQAFPQTFFSHMRDAIHAPAFGGARAAWEFVDPGVARFELSLVLHESDERLHGFLEYDRGLLAPATAERLAQDYVRLLGRALAEPEPPLSELGSCCTARTARRSARSLPVRLRRAAGDGA